MTQKERIELLEGVLEKLTKTNKDMVDSFNKSINECKQKISDLENKLGKLEEMYVTNSKLNSSNYENIPNVYDPYSDFGIMKTMSKGNHTKNNTINTDNSGINVVSLFLNIKDSIDNINQNVSYLNSSVGVIRNSLNISDIKSIVNTPQKFNTIEEPLTTIEPKVDNVESNFVNTPNNQRPVVKETVISKPLACSQVVEIRNSTKTVEELALEYGVPEITIDKILAGKMYVHCK